MNVAIAGLSAVFIAVAVYLLLSRSIIRMLLGLAVLGNAVNLVIFVSGRLTRAVPPIVPQGVDTPVGAVANPLPQALILTAIVIGFSIFIFLLVLALRTYQALGVDNTDAMRLAEPKTPPQPPLSY